MTKTRAALLGMLALLILSGVAASSASAAGPYWNVQGARLGQGATKQVKLQAKGTFVFGLGFAGVSATVTCHNSFSEGGTILGQGNFQGQDKGRLTFQQCTTVSDSGCETTGPITTNQLKSHLAYNPNSKQQKFVDVLEPQQGTTFVEIHLTCILEGTVGGSVAAEIVPVGSESQEILMSFPVLPIATVVHEQQTEPIELHNGGKGQVKLSGAYGARLATNEQWGVFGQQRSAIPVGTHVVPTGLRWRRSGRGPGQRPGRD